MRYLLLVMVIIWLATCLVVGCSPYRSEGKIAKVSEEPFVEYSVGDFDEDVIDVEDQAKIYHVKYVHVTL